MAIVPSRRLMVYVIAGVIVLLVGMLGLLSMRGDSGKAELLGSEILSAEGLGSGTGESVPGAAGLNGGEPLSPTTSTTAMIYVQVAGAVRRPGVYQVPSETRLFQAVMEAGGFTEEADEQALVLAARLKDGCRIYVPRLGETVSQPIEPAPEEGVSGDETSTEVVSLNTATLEQLDSLPGIGPAIARDIISFRETNGPFTSVDQLTDVPGIGPARLEQLRPLVGL